jgi:sugar phosphate permease
MSFISMTLAATSGIPKHLSGIASGILNTSQQIGGAIGLAILSAVYASTFKSHIRTGSYKAAQVNGFHDALIIGFILAIGAALVAFFVVRNERVKPEPAAA